MLFLLWAFNLTVALGLQPILLDLVSLDLKLALVYVFDAGFSIDIWASYNYFALGLQYFCIGVCDHSLAFHFFFQTMGFQHFFSRIYNETLRGTSMASVSNKHLTGSWPKTIVLGS